MALIGLSASPASSPPRIDTHTRHIVLSRECNPDGYLAAKTLPQAHSSGALIVPLTFPLSVFRNESFNTNRFVIDAGHISFTLFVDRLPIIG